MPWVGCHGSSFPNNLDSAGCDLAIVLAGIDIVPCPALGDGSRDSGKMAKTNLEKGEEEEDDRVIGKLQYILTSVDMVSFIE